MCIYIYYTYYIYVYIYIIKVNYSIKRLCQNAFRSDLSTQIKNPLSFDELLHTNY